MRAGRPAGLLTSPTLRLLVLATLASLLLAPSPPTMAEQWKKALAEVDEALEKNPNGVSEDSLNSCRSMRKTAVLLYKMGQHPRAFRRIKACRQLLGIDEGPYGWRGPLGAPWPT